MASERLMRGLDLFSGIGGISLALSPWVNTIAYCEQDRYAQSVLLSRMADGSLHKAPIWDDVQTLTGEMLPSVDIIFGGFPCQDLSVAGAGKGLAGERSGLFFEIIRLVKETNPAFVFLENVPAIRTRGLSQVINAFAEVGYDCRWTCISASSVGAPHKRERWFLLAHANGSGLRIESWGGRRQEGEGSAFSGFNGENRAVADANGMRKQSEQEDWGDAPDWSRHGRENVANPKRERLEGFVRKARKSEKSEFGGSGSFMADTTGAGVSRNKRKRGGTTGPRIWSQSCDEGWWTFEPNVGRVVDGISVELDAIKRCLDAAIIEPQTAKSLIEAALEKTAREARVKCLGNSVVPAQVREAFEVLSGIGELK